MKLADALLVFGWAALSFAGVLFALLYLGVLLIADCSAACRARGEHLVAIGLLVLGLVVAAGAGYMAVRTFRRKRTSVA